MKLKEVIEETEWHDVEPALLRLYPEQKKNISGFEQVFNKLKQMPANESSITIKVMNVLDDFDCIEYADVSGYYSKSINNPEKQTQSLAIDFTPWNEWLGMEIDQISLEEFDKFELIAHCLYEMTFYGFNEDDIQAELVQIQKSVEELENMTEEEKQTQLKTWDELKRELDIGNE
ncbi:MAG: hypothetical protein JXA77_15470 [Bacteroidales bacterium]|nr:hypothetical protein [Bacteroidales bacterium]